MKNLILIGACFSIINGKAQHHILELTAQEKKKQSSEVVFVISNREALALEEITTYETCNSPRETQEVTIFIYRHLAIKGFAILTATSGFT